MGTENFDVAHLALNVHFGIQNFVKVLLYKTKKRVVRPPLVYRIGVDMVLCTLSYRFLELVPWRKHTDHSELDVESVPLEESSPFAEVEGFTWWWLSSLPLVRGLPNLDLILVPMGKGSYIRKQICLVDGTRNKKVKLYSLSKIAQ